MGFPSGSVGKESTCNAGEDLGLIPGLGRSPGGEHGNHSSILAWRIPMERGAWWVTVHRVTKSRMWLSDQAELMVQPSLDISEVWLNMPLYKSNLV